MILVTWQTPEQNFMEIDDFCKNFAGKQKFTECQADRMVQKTSQFASYW